MVEGYDYGSVPDNVGQEPGYIEFERPKTAFTGEQQKENQKNQQPRDSSEPQKRPDDKQGTRRK